MTMIMMMTIRDRSAGLSEDRVFGWLVFKPLIPKCCLYILYLLCDAWRLAM